MKKKFTITLIAAILITFLILSYGFVKPVKRVFGCYIFNDGYLKDEICLMENGDFTQQYSLLESSKEVYNRGKLTSFSFDENGKEFTIITLNSYRIISNDGSIIMEKDIDIKPRSELFYGSYFKVSTERGSRDYIKKD